MVCDTNRRMSPLLKNFFISSFPNTPAEMDKDQFMSVVFLEPKAHTVLNAGARPRKDDLQRELED
jgi:hypothetical protein